MSAAPSHVATGEVGLLADENAQRLCSIFGEAGYRCLVDLRDLSAAHGPERFDRLFRVGLDTVASWGTELLREETLRLETQYPELPALFAFVYLTLVELSHAAVEELEVPPVEEVYHAFMRRVASAPDVGRGRGFFELSHACRRATFVEALRNALHDVLQRRRSGAGGRARRRTAAAPEEAKPRPDAALPPPGSPSPLTQAVLREAAGSSVAASETRAVTLPGEGCVFGEEPPPASCPPSAPANPQQ